MSVMSEKDLPENQRATWLKAMSAMELKNYGYAVQLLQAVLRSHPDFLLARQLARKAAAQKNSGKKGLLGGLSSASFSMMKVQSLVKKDPVAAMDAIEKLLESEPYSPQVNQLLKEAGIAAKMPHVALFALETIVEGNPKDTKTMHELAKLYLANELPDKAVDIYGRILQISPNDLAAVKGGKDASAALSMMRGGWQREDTTYRDLIRDKEQAVALEQQNRAFRTDEMIDSLIAEASALYEKDPSNVDTARRMGELHEQKNDLANAILWFQYAAELSSNTDSSLVRKVADLRLRQIDESIAGFEIYLAENPDDPKAAEYTEQLAQVRRQRAEYLLEEAKKRIERNPSDLQLRFELGEILVELGEYKEAIMELQKAQSNPNVRLRAMSLLGQCYSGRGMFDLAATILEKAAAELFQMDNVKKDIIYNLGLVYEKMANQEKHIACIQQIYEVDAGYRDVAERVEGSYGA